MIIAEGSASSCRPDRVKVGGDAQPGMADVERDHVRTVLESTGWRIRGNGGAAELLGLQPTTLETRMLKLGLARPRLAV
jgi:transcriptional regulator with GAF, ATPase, and Fis domain